MITNKHQNQPLMISTASSQEQKITRVFAVQGASAGRFVRIRFMEGSPTAVSEMKVQGVMRE